MLADQGELGGIMMQMQKEKKTAEHYLLCRFATPFLRQEKKHVRQNMTTQKHLQLPRHLLLHFVFTAN